MEAGKEDAMDSKDYKLSKEEFEEYQAMKRLMTEVAGPVATNAGTTPGHVVSAAVRDTQQQQVSPFQGLNEKDMCLQSFMDMLEYLLNGLAVVFPECQKTKNAMEDFRLASHSKFAKIKLIESWHKTMKPYYQAVMERNEAHLRSAPIEWFDKLDIFKKWDDPELSQESKENMWCCLQSLNRFSGMYDSLHNIPQGLMSNIHGVAQQVLTSLQEGGSSLDDLDLFELGQQVVSQSSSSDMNAFVAAMPQISQNFGGFDNLMKMVQGGMGDLMKEFKQ